MINTEVYRRTCEQRDYWQDMCGVYKARAERLEKIIMQIDGKMGHGWTARLAEALTPLLRIDADGNITEVKL